MDIFKFAIKDKGELAKSIIQMLREMAVSHDFIKEEKKVPNALTKKTLMILKSTLLKVWLIYSTTSNVSNII